MKNSTVMKNAVKIVVYVNNSQFGIHVYVAPIAIR